MFAVVWFLVLIPYSYCQNSHTPVFPSQSTTYEVSEVTLVGDDVFTCLATDDDTGPAATLRYSIVGGSGAGVFSVVADTCDVTVAQQLDFEKISEYDVIIQVVDLDPVSPRSASATFTVQVTDVNEHDPYFLEVPQAPIFLPESTPVNVPFLDCSGDDDDSSAQLSGQVGYEIVAGNEENFFTVDPAAGNMLLSKSLDYDSQTSTFNITVRIYDLDPTAPRSAEQVYRLCITDVNDNKPRWVDKLPSPIKMVENTPLGTHLGRCSATDGDSPLHPSGHVRYLINRGNNLALFYLDPYTCDLYVNGLLDYEQETKHTLKIIAFDLDTDNPLRSKVMKVNVKITDENDNGPACQSSVMMMEMSEVTKKKTVLMTMNCSDLDQGHSSSALRFNAVSKSTTLSVGKITGDVKLKSRVDWDDVTKSREHELRVQVTDNSDDPIIASATVSVIVTDADDQKPAFTQSSYVEYINETVPRGSTMFTISATDADAPGTLASRIQYGLQTAPSPDWFLIHPYTGEVIVKHALDTVDSVVESQFEVFAFSSDLANEKSTADVIVRIAGVDKSGPTFTQEVYHLAVEEVTAYTAPVLTIQTQDNDTEVRYSIEEGPLAIDNVTGEVEVKGQLDFEALSLYLVLVQAYGLHTPSFTSTATVILTVLPVNEFDPVWISGTDFVVPEDSVLGTVVFHLSARDDDSGWDGEVGYRSSLNPDLPFLVDQSGRVLLASPLDHETTEAYNFPVIVHDRSVIPERRRSVTTMVHVTVSDVNDLAPECRRVPVAVVVYPWIGSTVASMDCSLDGDSVNGQLSYEIVGGNLDNAFQMNSTSGELSTTQRPTLELYELRVEVSDGGRPPATSLVDVVVLVEPKLTLSGLPADVQVREDAAVGTEVFRITACCSFTSLQYELLSGNDGGHFRLHEGNGVITLVRHLDRELTSQHALRVKVSDERGQTVMATLVVNVEDVNDNPPVFNPVFSSLWVPEDVSPGTTISYWTATDSDQGVNGTLTYVLVDSANDTFSVDNSSGAITLVKAVDHEGGSSVTLLLAAVDGGEVALSATATMHVAITNRDEHSPQFLTSPDTVTVREDFPLGQVLFVLQAVDGDGPDVITYTLTDEDTPFLVLPGSGKVVLRAPLDREREDWYDLLFLALNDLGDSVGVDVEVQVEDVDDNDPVFTSSVYEFHMPHDTPADVIVGYVTVTDDDEGENADFTVSIVSGNEAGYFVMDGVGVKTTEPLFFALSDGIREFVLTLRAQKSGGSSDYGFSEAAVRIEVLTASSQPKFDFRALTLLIQENSPINSVICDLNATLLGAREGPDGTLRYVIRTGNTNGPFTIKEDTGELRVAGEIDYETDKEFTLVVDAENKVDPFVKHSLIVTINIINVNDHAPQPESSEYYFYVDEDSTPGTSVGQVIFTDDDADTLGDFFLFMSRCSKFTVDPGTGDVTVKEELNYNDEVRHGCVVTAKDKGQPPLSGVTLVMIEVLDVNDHSPHFEGAPYTLDVYENSPAGSTLTTIVAVDVDAGDNGNVTYFLTSGDPDNVFSLNSITGELVLTSALSASMTSHVVLHLQAADEGSPSLISRTNLTVNIIDVNDHVPVFAVTSASPDVVVGRLTDPGTELVALSASDDDLGYNGLVSFAITAGNADGLFYVNSSSGQLITRGWLTHAQDIHRLTITASDHGTPALAASTTVTIFVSPPVSNDTEATVHYLTWAVAENASVGSVVATFDPFPAPRADDYVILSGNHDDSFEVLMLPGGSAELRVKNSLDFESCSVYYLLVNVSVEDAEAFQKLVQVNVTDVNDNTPQFEDGPTLVLHVSEHAPAGQTVWTLRVRDADQPDTNGPLQFQIDTASVQGVLSVTALGQVQLMASPDFDLYQKVDAVISVRDSHKPQLSSTISVTLNIIDVDERQNVTVTSAVTMYISTEIAHNTKEGRVVHQLIAADFNLTETPTSTTTFLSLDTTGAFGIHPQSGEVTVTAPQRLANGSVYFQWVVSKVVEADGTSKSEMAMLRIDTFDKYENIVALQLASEVWELEAQKSALRQKLQDFFSSRQRVGIFDIIAFGMSARRRLLASASLALMYVVDDVTADELNSIMGPKTFLSQQDILQVLQQSSDGTPVAGLSGDPMAVELVMPYLTGDGDTSTSFTSSLHFPIIIAVLCVLVVVVVAFVVGCILYRAKRRRKWNMQCAKDKSLTTPTPAFFIRRDSLFYDDVSSTSTTSLLDDDSGMGDSVGSRSLPRKSRTPSSSESDGSGTEECGGGEITLSPKNLLKGQTGMAGERSLRDTGVSVTDAEKSKRGHRKRFIWKRSQPKAARNKFVYTTAKPPISWLPAVPDHPRSGRRDSNLSWYEFPRYGQRTSNLNGEGYNLSDPTSRRRGSQNWMGGDSTLAVSNRGESEDSPSSSRCSSISRYWRSSPYATSLSGRRASAAKVSTPVFTTGITGIASGTTGASTPFSSRATTPATNDASPALNSESTRSTISRYIRSIDPNPTVKITVPGHQVSWKPKRNTVKIFHEKLEWKAVSTIPKASSSSMRRPRPDNSLTQQALNFDRGWAEGHQNETESGRNGNRLQSHREPARETSKDGNRGKDTVLKNIFGTSATRRDSLYTSPSFSADFQK